MGLSPPSANAGLWARSRLVDNAIFWDDINSNSIYVPNVIGMTLKDAIFLLESRGLKVSFQGKGRVNKQSISPGKLVINYNSINISLG